MAVDAQLGLNFEEFQTGSGILTNYVEILGDIDTPLSIYAKLSKSSKDAFLLESVEGGDRIGRYSFIGHKSLQVLCQRDEDVYENLAQEIEKYSKPNHALDAKLPFFYKGFLGYFSFESVRFVEPSLEMRAGEHPDMYMNLVGSMVVFDHVKHKFFLISNHIGASASAEDLYAKSCEELQELKDLIYSKSELEHLDLDFASTFVPKTFREIEQGFHGLQFKSNTGFEAYAEMVERAKEHILEGDIFQVVPSHKMRADLKIDPLDFYRVLRAVNPSPYMFIFNVHQGLEEGFSLVGSSPEMLVKTHKGQNLATKFADDASNSSCNAGGALEQGSVAEIRPIAGTYPRSDSDEEDQRRAKALLNDEKEVAEHVMLVDLARNDLGRVCVSGTVEVAKTMFIEKYSHVMHIVSSVVGRLRDDLGARRGVDLLRACFPAGTLSGAPKVEAMDIIAKLERQPRGPYGGALGYIGFDGTVDMAIMIRTLLIKPDSVEIQAGGGVVADSEPDKEYQETYNKASALIKVIDILMSHR